MRWYAMDCNEELEAWSVWILFTWTICLDDSVEPSRKRLHEFLIHFGSENIKNNRLSQNHRFLNNSFTETNKKLKECVDVWLLIVCVQITEIDFIWLCCAMRNITIMGKIYAKPHTIVKQICFPNGNALSLSLSLFSLLKNWKHDEVWGSAEILPSALFSQDRLPDELISAETTCIKRIAFFFCLLWNFMGVLY